MLHTFYNTTNLFRQFSFIFFVILVRISFLVIYHKSTNTHLNFLGLSHEEVVKGLKEGLVLQCPENTPKSMYKLMLLTWNPKASSRPSFRTLYRELETIEKELSLIQKHFRSQKSILSETGRMTPQSPCKSFV